MKSVCLLLLCAVAASAIAACEPHPHSDLEKLEYHGEFAKKGKGQPEHHEAHATP